MKKTVAKPIEVPDSDYCWEPKPPHELCEWFDNEGGYPTCDQGLGSLSYEKTGGVRKCEACRKLKSFFE